jgi:hypothetical protein
MQIDGRAKGFRCREEWLVGGVVEVAALAMAVLAGSQA